MKTLNPLKAPFGKGKFSPIRNVYYGPEGEDLEIAGVLASVENWRKILLPLLKNPRGK